MKIKDLNILNKHGYNSGWHSGMQRIDTIAWNEIILQSIKPEIIGVIAKGFQDEGRELKIQFKHKEYNKLNETQKKGICKIFTENAGKTIAEILELNFENE